MALTIGGLKNCKDGHGDFGFYVVGENMMEMHFLGFTAPKQDYVRQTVEIALSSLLNGLKHNPELEFPLPEVGYGSSKANNLEKIQALKRA